MNKIGIFGGTFNPIHYGHLRTALEVKEHFSLDKVLFIPSYIPPHKSSDDIIPSDKRLFMTIMAVSNYEGFAISDIEISREDVSYSIDTVNAIKEEYGDARLSFIIGADAFFDINSWNRYDELMFLCDFIVMTRPGTVLKEPGELFPEPVGSRFRYDKLCNLYESDKGNRIFFHDVTELDISSTKIRKLCKMKSSIKYLLPEKVEKYIEEHSLYQ